MRGSSRAPSAQPGGEMHVQILAMDGQPCQQGCQQGSKADAQGPTIPSGRNTYVRSMPANLVYVTGLTPPIMACRHRVRSSN